MKYTLIFMVTLLAALLVAVFARGQGAELARASTGQARQLVPILCVAILMGGCVEVLLPKGIVEHWLSDAAGWRGIVIAWAAGALTPGGSIIGLPLVAGFARAGVGLPALMTYLVSLSTLSILRLPLELGILGGKLTLMRLATCLALPPISGLLTRGFLLIVRGV